MLDTFTNCEFQLKVFDVSLEMSRDPKNYFGTEEMLV